MFVESFLKKQLSVRNCQVFGDLEVCDRSVLLKEALDIILYARITSEKEKADICDIGKLC
jgi:hypothetical protein